MEDEFEAMKLFEHHAMHLFLVGPRLEPHIIAALLRLESDHLVVCSWNPNKVHPLDCELTEKGLQLLEYLKKHEWD